MNRSKKIKELLRRSFKKAPYGSDLTEMDQRILSDASTNMKKALASNQLAKSISLWRITMKTVLSKKVKR